MAGLYELYVNDGENERLIQDAQDAMKYTFQNCKMILRKREIKLKEKEEKQISICELNSKPIKNL